MASATPTPVASLLPETFGLRQRLAALRRQMHRIACVRGVSLLLAVLLLGCLAIGLLDWSCNLPSLVRAFFLVVLLTAIGVVTIHYLVRPLRERSDNLTLALRIEEAYPSLNDALASTVQFLDQPDSAGIPGSSAMRHEAIRRALAIAENCNFNCIVDQRGLFPGLLAALAAANLVWPLFLFAPFLFVTALTRLADPFGSHAWPRQTQIELDAPRLQIGRNEPFNVTGQLKGVIPETARVVFRFDHSQPLEQHCEIKREGNSVGRLSAHLEPGKISTSFSFQVLANDAVSKEYKVQVLASPGLANFNGGPSPQVQLFFPTYTDLPSPVTLTPGSGNIEAVAGTSVIFRAAADRPLQRAWIEFMPENRATLLSAFLAPLAATRPLTVITALAGGRTTWEPVPARLDASRTILTISFMPQVNGFYVLHFEDAIGLRSSKLFELRLRSDPAPTVTLERPSPSRDILQMLPTSVVNIQASVEDIFYAVKSVQLRYRTCKALAGANASLGEMRPLPLYDHATARDKLLPLLGPTVQLWKSFRPRPTRVDIRYFLSLKRIAHLDGTPLQEGDTVIIEAAADDFDDVSVDKQPGTSHEVEIRIVGPNTLDLVLNQEQAVVQQELLKLREKEREAIQKVLDVERRLKRGEKLKAEEQSQLSQAEQIQLQIHERISDEERGLRARIARIQETLKQNGMQNSAVRDRMADVARELDRLAEREMQQVEDRLAAARKQAAQQAQLEEKAQEAEKQARLEEETASKKMAAAQQVKDQPNAKEQQGRLEEEARRQQQHAQAALQKAEELKQQAARDREEAARQTPRQAITEVRRSQEEIEKTLNDLLMRLEPWSSAREIKGEAKRLLQEQKQLQTQLEESKEKLQGKTPDDLTRQEKADLQALKEQQQRLEERMRQLLDKMDRIAVQRAEKDAETARELREAHDQALKGDIIGQMKSAQEQISKNQLNQAQQSQKNSIDELEKLVKNLEDRREAELDRLAKKLKEAQQRLEDLQKEQELLTKKIKEAQQNTDPAQREQELKVLSLQQQKLQEKTQELVKQLSRMRAERASQALGKAGAQMDQAGRQLQKGQNPEDPQEALDRLNEAKREVEQARKQAEEELQREQLVRVAETLIRIKERQEGLNNEAARIQTAVQQAGEWRRTLRNSSLVQLGDSQKGLSEETQSVAEKELAGTPVFSRMIRRSAEAMRDTQKRVEQMREKPPIPKKLPDAELTRLQTLATLRLTQVLDAIKEQTAEGNPRQQAGGGPGGDSGEGSRSGPQDPGLPPLAQLKMLKSLQLEVNKATEEFKKNHPVLDKLDDARKNELTAIRKQQQDVLELLEELRRPADEPSAAEGEKE